jgi:hypothetical protein
MLEVLGIRDAEKIVPIEDDILPTDPISENMNLINGKPVKAFIYQDHEAHIQAHMSMSQNPQIQELMQQNPNAKAVMAAGAAHIAEHLAFAYRRKIEEELGVPLPPPDEPLPEDVELRLSKLVAQASAQLSGKAQAQAQAEKNAQMQQDPIIQMQQQELQIKQQQAQSKADAEMAKIQLEAEKAMDKASLEREKLDQQERIETAKLGVKVAEIEAEEERSMAESQVDAFKIGVDIAKDVLGDNE